MSPAVRCHHPLEELIRRNEGLVRQIIRHRCHQPEVVDDVIADTWECAARQFDRGLMHEVTPAWLVTVAQRRLIDHWRRQKATQRRRQRAELHLPAPSDTVAATITASADPLLALISARHGQALRLRYLNGYGVSEVAHRMDLSYVAAESLLARARRALRQQLQRT